MSPDLARSTTSKTLHSKSIQTRVRVTLSRVHKDAAFFGRSSKNRTYGWRSSSLCSTLLEVGRAVPGGRVEFGGVERGLGGGVDPAESLIGFGLGWVDEVALVGGRSAGGEAFPLVERVEGLRCEGKF